MNRLKIIIKTIILMLIVFPVYLTCLPELRATLEEEEEEVAGSRSFRHAPGEIIVVLKEGKTLKDIEELNIEYDVTSIEIISKSMNMYLLKTDEQVDSDAMSIHYHRSPAVRSADPNYILKDTESLPSLEDECESCKKLKGEKK